MNTNVFDFVNSLLSERERSWLMSSNHMAAVHYRRMKGYTYDKDTEKKLIWLLLGIMANGTAYSFSDSLIKKISNLYIDSGIVLER